MIARQWIVLFSAILLLVGLSLGASGCPLVPPSGLTGDPVAGEALFDNTCSRCHVLTFLQSHRDQIIPNLRMLNPAMVGISLTDQQVADLKAFFSQ